MTTSLQFNGPRLIGLLFLVLLGAEVLFVLGDATINVERWVDSGPVRRFFNITREDGIASWFAVTQTWMLGLTAALLSAMVRAKGGSASSRVGWAILAAFFLYMAIDDGTQLHERVGSWVKAMVLGEGAESRAIGIFPSYTWQLVFLPIFGSLGVFMLWFLNRELTTTTDKVIVVMAVGLLVVAVIADFFEGIEKGHPLDLYSWLRQALDTSLGRVRHYAKSFEEFLEMFSMTLLWMVLLRHLVRIAPTFTVELRRPA